MMPFQCFVFMLHRIIWSVTKNIFDIDLVLICWSHTRKLFWPVFARSKVLSGPGELIRASKKEESRQSPLFGPGIRHAGNDAGRDGKKNFWRISQTLSEQLSQRGHPLTCQKIFTFKIGSTTSCLNCLEISTISESNWSSMMTLKNILCNEIKRRRHELKHEKFLYCWQHLVQQNSGAQWPFPGVPPRGRLFPRSPNLTSKHKYLFLWINFTFFVYFFHFFEISFFEIFLKFFKN